jgi:hypothetical protein
MLTSLVLALGLSFSGSQDQSGAKNYTFDVSQTSKEVQAGKSGNFKLTIKPADGFHVSPDAPLKIGLEASGLDLSKKALGHDDAKDKKSFAPEFEVKFAAVEAGSKSITVDAMFFVCNEKLCERKTEKVSVPVAVKP